MPYIKQKDRVALRPLVEALMDELSKQKSMDKAVGTVNYTFSRILGRVLNIHGLRYCNLNALIGVLECCKMELYRRIAVPYEEKKIADNGDVFLTELTDRDHRK